MEVLFWLLPAAVVTCVAMLWVGWWGREGRGVVDRETGARRLGEALSREPRNRPGYAAPQPPADPHSGVALRASRTRPVVVPAEAEADVEAAAQAEEAPVAASEADAGESTDRDRRAS